MRKLIVKEKEYAAARVVSGGSAPEQYAGAELEKYLGKIGIPEGDGARFDVRIDPALERDGYAVEPGEDGVVSIRGGNGRGVIYGVYALLERCAGTRFFMPGLEVLGNGDMEISHGFSHTPVFEMRQSDWPCGNGDPDWCVKNGVNQRAIPAEMGGHIRYGGFVHTIGGFTGVPQDKQPCFSDSEVLKKTIAGVRAILEKDPEVTIVSVSQNDNQNYCTCEKCAAVDAEEGSHMGTVLRFVNAVAADIAKDYPDVVIDTLAYQFTRKAPKITKPLPNVCIRLCSIECCFSHPLDDPSCPENRAFAQDIVEWNKICDRIYIWDYVTNFRYYVPTFPNFGVLRKNMRFFAEHGVKGMYPEGNYNSPKSGEFGELRCYLLARLMMDPLMSETDYSRHMDEFLAAYYGEGWRYIRSYIDWTVAEAAGGHMNIWNPPFSVIPQEKFAAMEETFEQWWNMAEAMAGDRLEAVRRSRIQWRVIRLMLHPDAGAARILLDDMKAQDIRWCEWAAEPPKPDLSASPATWR